MASWTLGHPERRRGGADVLGGTLCRWHPWQGALGGWGGQGHWQLMAPTRLHPLPRGDPSQVSRTRLKRKRPRKASGLTSMAASVGHVATTFRKTLQLRDVDSPGGRGPNVSAAAPGTCIYMHIHMLQCKHFFCITPLRICMCVNALWLFGRVLSNLLCLKKRAFQMVTFLSGLSKFVRSVKI